MMPVAVMTPTNGRTRGPSDVRSSTTDRSTRELATDSTVTLLPLAARGDPRAIEILIGRMRPYLKRFGHGRLPRWARSRAETEDLVQESLIRALKHLPRFQRIAARDGGVRRSRLGGGGRRIGGRVVGGGAHLAAEYIDGGRVDHVTARLGRRSKHTAHMLGPWTERG